MSSATCAWPWAVGEGPDEAVALARAALAAPLPAAEPAADGVDALRRRARAYVVGCCALSLDGRVCLVTDHRILPLSWTRDAYWCARMLLDAGDPGARALVAGHLRWLFEAAERTDGAWGRAHLPNGRVKDRAFQLDQQCYPLLELAEYALETGDATPHAAAVPAVLDVLERRRDPATGLYPTEETPGDDPLSLPFHCSSHMLLWRTLDRLRAAAPVLSLQAGLLARAAAEVRQAVRARFEVGGRFAYAIDGRGQALDYHDANDLPMAFAPLWGFCAPDDPVWRETVRFAFSPQNPGWAGGDAGGLGSVHTPGAWPLGDVQEYLAARLLHDERRAARVLDRLVATACWDGALPEARDPATGAVRSRHWFAWPSAALAVALTAAPGP